MIKFTPLLDRVLVEPITVKESVVNGIHIPQGHMDGPAEGIVVRLGTGRTKEDGSRTQFEVKVADRVLFNRHHGQEVKIDGRMFKMFDTHELLAVVE